MVLDRPFAALVKQANFHDAATPCLADLKVMAIESVVFNMLRCTGS